MDNKEQSAHDKAQIVVKLIENGVLVKTGPAWFSFATWPEAAEHIGQRLKTLQGERAGAGRDGCV